MLRPTSLICSSVLLPPPPPSTPPLLYMPSRSFMLAFLSAGVVISLMADSSPTGKTTPRVLLSFPPPSACLSDGDVLRCHLTSFASAFPLFLLSLQTVVAVVAVTRVCVSICGAAWWGRERSLCWLRWGGEGVPRHVLDSSLALCVSTFGTGPLVVSMCALLLPRRAALPSPLLPCPHRTVPFDHYSFFLSFFFSSSTCACELLWRSALWGHLLRCCLPGASSSPRRPRARGMGSLRGRREVLLSAALVTVPPPLVGPSVPRSPPSSPPHVPFPG